MADSSLNLIPNTDLDNDDGYCDLDDKDFLFVGDALSSGYFGIELGKVKNGDWVGVIGCGPVGLCTLICGRLKGAKLIAFDIDNKCLDYAKKCGLADHYINPNDFKSDEELTKKIEEICGEQKGCDCTVEVAGTDESFQMAWKITRPNGIVSLVAMYEKNQVLPLPIMYGKNLIFKTGGVDAINCDYLIKLIKENKISTRELVTHEYIFEDILDAFKLFREKKEFCVKIAIKL
jgi:alcohol dehydrogenase